MRAPLDLPQMFNVASAHSVTSIDHNILGDQLATDVIGLVHALLPVGERYVD